MSRVFAAWRALEREQRLTALAALGLFLSMFLPWYSKTDTLVRGNRAFSTQASLTAFGAFSFVEAAVLLTSAAVLAMLFARAERRGFWLPGGDGLIVTIAGGWVALLIFYRLLDKPGLQGNDRISATVGVKWGIFIALLVALGLLYSGTRQRALERDQPPPLGAEPGPDRSGPPESARPEHTAATHALRGDLQVARVPPTAPADTEPVVARRRPRYPPAPGEQMSIEDSATRAAPRVGAEQLSIEDPPES